MNDTNALRRMLQPKGVAIVGATPKSGHVANGVVQNLLKGGSFDAHSNKGFKGNIYPVNPNYNEVLGLKCYADVRDIRGKVDLAVIGVPAQFVYDVVKSCAAKGVAGAIIISAGFGEHSSEGKKLEKEIASFGKKHGVRIIGPNCLGAIRTSSRLNASFAPAMPPEGGVAFLSQSGALVDSIIDWSIERNYGFSTVISYGNKSDLDIHDYLEYLEEDTKTRSIALYIEGIDDGRKFMKIASRVNLKKPIVVLKGGKTSAGAQAISSHTGSLAGSYEVYKTAFRQANLTIAGSVEELFDYAHVLSTQPPCKGPVAIITNAGGGGVLCADHCHEQGVPLVTLSERVLKKLDATGLMHPAYSRRNPLDIVGDALPERYIAAIETLMADKAVGGLIVIQTLQTMTDSKKNALACVKAFKAGDKPLICSFMGGKYTQEGADILWKNGIPNNNDLVRTAKAMKILIDRAKVQH